MPFNTPCFSLAQSIGVAVTLPNLIFALKTFSKFILYAGAVACCVAGLAAICAAIRDKAQFPDDPNQLGLATIYACLAVTPAFMLLTGFKTKTWHWVFISMVEVIVIALASFALFVLIGMALTTPG